MQVQPRPLRERISDPDQGSDAAFYPNLAPAVVAIGAAPRRAVRSRFQSAIRIVTRRSNGQPYASTEAVSPTDSSSMRGSAKP